MNFKDFEGFKRIKNKKNITINQIFEILKKYQKELNEVLYDEINDRIIIDIRGKYNILIRFSGDEIIIERKLDAGYSEYENNYLEQGKTILLADADRMVDQVFDLINDYIDDGKIREHITKPQNILRMEQTENKVLGGALAIGTQFIVTDDSTNKEIYEVTQKAVNRLYSLENLRMKREEAVINYSEMKKDKFLILRHPFENIVIKLDRNSQKRTFISTFSTKELKITADFSNNHYLVELNDIVIGAIDCLDPLLKLNYRIEVNDMEYEFLLVSIAVVVDLYSKKSKEGI